MKLDGAIGIFNLGGGNKIVVDGPGTLLTVTGSGLSFFQDAGDQVIVSGGAQVTTSELNEAGSYGTNELIITDQGTQMTIGPLTRISELQLSVSNGARLNCSGDIVTEYGNNTLLVSGTGSQLLLPTNAVWLGHNFGSGGTSYGNQLIIQAGGLVEAANLFLVSPSNYVSVAGSLFVTNSTGSGTLELGGGGSGGALTITGSVVADMVSLQGNSSFDAGSGGSVSFPSGILMTKGLSGDNGLTFIVGDGTNTGNYVMQGGTHSFVNGLVISSNSVLSGCGTVMGSVTNYGLIILTNGCDMDFSGPVVNDGSILALNGTVYFNSTFINNGTFIQTPGIIGLSFSGNDVVVQLNTVSNYLQDVQFRSNLTSGIWTTLTNGLLGTGNPMTFTDFGSRTNSQRFYRLLFHY